jgi:cation:H+ antiporter
MTLAILQFVLAAIVIVIAGTFLSRFADEIAEITGLGRLLIGSILLAGATSLPELTVDISAVRGGLPNIAFGDLLGSSLFNLMILAVLDLSTQSRGWMLSRQAAGHALSGTVSVSLTALVGICLVTQSLSAHGQFLGISYGLWLVLIGYALGVRLVYYDQQVAAASTAKTPVLDDGEKPLSWKKTVAGFLIAAICIVIAGPYLADAAGKISDATGLGKSFVGTTLVAASTSLPEFVASMAALRMGAHDLAIGNVFGSNAFNMLLFPILDLFAPGPLLADVSSGHAITAFAAILATQVVVLGQLYLVERRRRVIDPDATLVLLIIFGALYIVYQMGGE